MVKKDVHCTVLYSTEALYVDLEDNASQEPDYALERRTKTAHARTQAGQSAVKLFILKDSPLSKYSSNVEYQLFLFVCVVYTHNR